jgi:2-oxoisovalerate dehydrogenase E1 component
LSLALPAADERREPLATQEEIAKLILKLSHDKFITRESAQRDLLRIGKPALESLQKAIRNTTDPEVLRRAKEIVEQLDPGGARRAELEKTRATVRKAIEAANDAPPTSSEHGLFAAEAIGSGPSDEEVRIQSLVVQPGCVLRAGDVLAEVEASKASFEITSPVSGTVEQVLVKEDDLVVVGRPIVMIRTATGARAKPITEERPDRPLLRRRNKPIFGMRKTETPGVIRPRRVGIAGVAVTTGSRQVSNHDILVHHPGRTDNDVLRRTGIASRYWVAPGEGVRSLAVRAARKVLERSGLTVGDAELLVCATVTPDMVAPSLACRVLADLSDGSCSAEAQAFDINAACSGYLYALQIAYDYLQSQPDGRVLVVTSEVMSERVNPEDFDTAFLFGDAASATLLVGESHWDAARFEVSRPVLSAKGDKEQSLYVPLLRNGRSIEMHGTRIFMEATRAMVSMLQRACGASHLGVEDLSLVIPHQANQRILDAVAQRAGVRVFSNIRHLGNTSSTTIPLALHDVWASVEEGEQIGLCSFGGGFTSGAAILRSVRVPMQSEVVEEAAQPHEFSS